MGFKIESALLEACVLSVLSKGDTYGYVLTQSMKQVLDISESTLYPVLRRLQKNEYLRTYDPVSYTHLNTQRAGSGRIPD